MVHQDIRILLPLGLVSKGDTVVFEFLVNNTFRFRVLDLERSQRVSLYMEDNHFMTNTDLLCQ